MIIFLVDIRAFITRQVAEQQAKLVNGKVLEVTIDSGIFVDPNKDVWVVCIRDSKITYVATCNYRIDINGNLIETCFTKIGHVYYWQGYADSKQDAEGQAHEAWRQSKDASG